MNTADEYTPNPPDTKSERVGATEGNDWTPVRVPGGDQGGPGDRHPADADAESAQEEAEADFDAYDETTGG